MSTRFTVTWYSSFGFKFLNMKSIQSKLRHLLTGEPFFCHQNRGDPHSLQKLIFGYNSKGCLEIPKGAIRRTLAFHIQINQFMEFLHDGAPDRMQVYFIPCISRGALYSIHKLNWHLEFLNAFHFSKQTITNRFLK